MKGFGKGVKITVNPDADIPALTPAQLQLIADVKTKYGYRSYAYDRKDTSRDDNHV